MIEEMTAEQLFCWLAYAEVEPFGEERADVRSGVATAGLANIVIAAAGGKKMLKPSDFMPNFKPVQVQSAQFKPSGPKRRITSEEEWKRLMAPLDQIAKEYLEKKQRQLEKQQRHQVRQ